MSAPRLGRAIAVACAWLGVAGCFQPATIEGRPCPCGDGYVCCANQCMQAKRGDTCAAEAGVAPPDASIDRNVSEASEPRDAAPDRDGGDPEGGDAEVGDAAPDAHDAARDTDAATDGPACFGDGGQGQTTARVLGADFLARGSAPTDQIYPGSFKLGPCERLLNDDAVVVYTQDQSSIPPLTAGLTILHTFDPAGPLMTSPAAQPPGKYYIDSPKLVYDAHTATYNYSFHGVNFVTCPDAGVCQYIDTTEYRVVIGVVR